MICDLEEEGESQRTTRSISEVAQRVQGPHENQRENDDDHNENLAGG